MTGRLNLNVFESIAESKDYEINTAEYRSCQFLLNPVVFAKPHKGTVKRTSPSRYDSGDALKRRYCLIMDRIDVSLV